MDIQTEKTGQERMQDFVNEYSALCKRYKYQINAQPRWIITNHGSYELTIQLSVKEVESENNK